MTTSQEVLASQIRHLSDQIDRIQKQTENIPVYASKVEAVEQEVKALTERKIPWMGIATLSFALIGSIGGWGWSQSQQLTALTEKISAFQGSIGESKASMQKQIDRLEGNVKDLQDQLNKRIDAGQKNGKH
jgi:flagellar capping protein FliD